MKKILNYLLVLVLTCSIYLTGFADGVELGFFSAIKNQIKSFVNRDFICYPVYMIEDDGAGEIGIRQEIRCRLKF